MKKSEFVNRLHSAIRAYEYAKKHEALKVPSLPPLSDDPVECAKENGIYCGETQGIDEIVSVISNFTTLSENSNYVPMLMSMEMVEKAWEYYEGLSRQQRVRRGWTGTAD